VGGDTARLFVALDLPEAVSSALARWAPEGDCATIEDRSRGLDRLQSRLAIALAELGVYPPERRPFNPHVTLARVSGGRGHRGRGGTGSSLGRAGQRLLAPVPFRASSMTLLRSRISSAGSVCEPLSSVFLDSPA
jgi:2'-5' RNA ligase